jgi:diguanylate cyclase (GGDEF)-like protein/PAS domain S-box-containing protein
MPDRPTASRPPETPTDSRQPEQPAERWMSELHALLQQLQYSSPGSAAPVISPQVDNQLVQVRLGVAGSLFTALRCKHPPAAAHALRVSLTVSAWCMLREMSAEQRDAIEIAALLHDVGMIGVPDAVLQKPGSLDSEEMLEIERSREMSLEILSSACADPSVLEIVENVPTWFDGSRGDPLADDDVPLGARMIAIVEAFDAMTTAQVFRSAMSLERALAELFSCAGTQFDPELVQEFAQLAEADSGKLYAAASGRWLQSLDPETGDSFWQLRECATAKKPAAENSAFNAKLLSNMHDAVVFVDSDLKVLLWNHGAERLTGISSASICQRLWAPEVLNMRDEKAAVIAESEGPLFWAIRSGVQSLRRLTIQGRTGHRIPVDTHAIPVTDDDGNTLGAVLLLHDASPEISLEERCQSLHEKATKDSLTQVANRAEFDRVHSTFIEAHVQRQLPCSLIICDLDRFKQVNDTCGHQAGDDVIKCLATLLKSSCRPGDLVARYGGEEFVLLYADCDQASATARADEVRRRLSQVPQERMDGRSVTASFGVTENQPGDTPETMLRRADRALLTAKDQGRNRVVQLGAGSSTEKTESKMRFWQRGKSGPGLVLQQDLLTPVPIRVAIEKLRGFVADHEARILSIDGNVVRLLIDDNQTSLRRRRTDRPVVFKVDLELEEQRVAASEESKPSERGTSWTKIHVSISPKRNRDRRRDDVAERARQVLVSFRSYLMASAESPPTQGVLRRAGSILAPWLMRR